MRAYEVVEMVEAAFHEIFKTDTMTKIDGSMIHTLVVYSETHIVLYTIDISGSESPYRFTSIDLDVKETDDCFHDSTIGTCDSITIACSEFLNRIKSILTENRFMFTTFTTRGE